MHPSLSTRLRRGLSALPTLGVALLPKVACPACWPAYAGLLGAVGLEGLLDESYLLPLTLAFVGVAFALSARRAWRARPGARASSLQAWLPVGLTGASGAAIALGKFQYESQVLFYVGIVGFFVASFWGRRSCAVQRQDCASRRAPCQFSELSN